MAGISSSYLIRTAVSLKSQTDGKITVKLSFATSNVLDPLA